MIAVCAYSVHYFRVDKPKHSVQLSPLEDICLHLDDSLDPVNAGMLSCHRSGDRCRLWNADTILPPHMFVEAADTTVLGLLYLLHQLAK